MHIRAPSLFLSCLILGSCGSASSVEVMRAASPDGALVARVFEGNGGATTSFSYDVVVGPATEPQTKVGSFFGAVRSACAYGVNIRWAGDNALIISYDDAKSANVVPTAKIADRRIRIVAKAGVSDPTAPCGGMEYSQQGKVVVVR